MRFELEAAPEASGQVDPKPKAGRVRREHTDTGPPPGEHDPAPPAEGAASRLHFEPEVAPGSSGQHDPKPGGGKYRQQSQQGRPSERLHREAKKTARADKRFEKSGRRAEHTGAKLDKAKGKLAAQKPPKKPGPIKTTGRAAGRQVHGYVHKKIYEVERENVGTEAAHRTELVGEGLARGGTRFVKKRIRTRPARQVRKWEKKDTKARATHEFQKVVRENPQLSSNPVSRFWQKRKLKKKYTQQAREAAKKGAKAAEKTAVTAQKIAAAVWGLVKRHPVVVMIILLLLALVVILSSVMGALTTVGNGLMGAVGGTSYVSSDEDIEAVEANYTALEKALRDKLARIESDYPSYDEYRYSVDEIGHDPFELASYLTAKYDGYTPAEVQAELQSLIGQQYTLTITEAVEVRYRTETRTDTWTDSEGNTHHDSYTVEVPYNYYILNVSLRNHSLGAVALANLDPEQTERYLVYQKLKGNRPYLFEGNIYVHPGEYTDYDIPPEALADPAFAALIAEAEKYLGYPYVWGGSSPSTSFDCSGFVCYVLDKSGVYPMSRTTATGIFNQSAKIPPAGAKPGDIIFFTGTYDSAGPVSHVGIYVGDNMMLHCASGGVQYARTDTKYWTEHFYAMGRL